jgi:uncharacterized protein YndB with AHSA1/START domain
MKWVLRIVGALVGLAVLAVLILFALSKRPDAGKGEVSIEIAQPPTVVWAWITEPEKLKQWVGWLAAVESDTTTAMGVGHREVWVMDDPNAKEPMRLPAVVTAEDAPHSGSAHIEVPGSFEGEVSYVLTDLGGGRTRLTQKADFRYTNPVFALLEPLVTPEANKKMATDLARLKAKAEAAGP